MENHCISTRGIYILVNVSSFISADIGLLEAPWKLASLLHVQGRTLVPLVTLARKYPLKMFVLFFTLNRGLRLHSVAPGPGIHVAHGATLRCPHTLEHWSPCSLLSSPPPPLVSSPLPSFPSHLLTNWDLCCCLFRHAPFSQ